jgi:Raf kinase inhibitor-like YbhB/YbcL family protein
MTATDPTPVKAYDGEAAMRRGATWLAVLALGLFPVSGVLGKGVRKMDGLKIFTHQFAHNGSIPVKYTCDGADASPPLKISGVPGGAKTLALIVDDPDAPAGTWVHWVVWNIPVDTSEVGEKAVPSGAVQGRNDWGRNDYGGPCPPSGSHRYFFKLYALDAVLTLGAATTKKDLERAMEGHVIGRAELIGVYKRK